ncbi:MAG: ankyrin repeat domain-containing protein [Cyclobacteriaceae bacterium]
MDLNIEIAGLIRSGDNDTLKTLINENPELVDGKTPQGISLLTLAAYCRNQYAIDLIASRKQETDLHEAAAIGHLNLVRQYVREAPEMLNSYSTDGFTPLGLACFFGHYNTAAFLIEAGADVNLPSGNDFQVSPIHSACAISDKPLAELLIDHGADVNAQQKSGSTALHSAAHHGQLGLVKYLVEKGASIKIKDADKLTPEKIAFAKGHDQIVSYLKGQ